MDFVSYSDLNPLIILFSFGFIFGTIFDLIGAAGRAIFGGGSKNTSSDQIDYKRQLEEQKEEFARQMALQAQESKRQTRTLLLGAGAFILLALLFFILMRKTR